MAGSSAGVGVEVPCVGGWVREVGICEGCVEDSLLDGVCSGIVVKGGVSGEGCWCEVFVRSGEVSIPCRLACVGGSSFPSGGSGAQNEVVGRDLADGQSEWLVCNCSRVS